MQSSHVSIPRWIAEMLVNMARGQHEKLAITAIAALENSLERSPGVNLMLDASTAHLSERDKGLLSDLASGQIENPHLPRTASHEYGWCIFMAGCGSDEETERQARELAANGASRGLIDLINRGEASGCMILNFDADADPVPGIPVCEECAGAV